jgi:hypothetical protein
MGLQNTLLATIRLLMSLELPAEDQKGRGSKVSNYFACCER